MAPRAHLYSGLAAHALWVSVSIVCGSLTWHLGKHDGAKRRKNRTLTWGLLGKGWGKCNTCIYPGKDEDLGVGGRSGRGLGLSPPLACGPGRGQHLWDVIPSETGKGHGVHTSGVSIRRQKWARASLGAGSSASLSTSLLHPNRGWSQG